MWEHDESVVWAHRLVVSSAVLASRADAVTVTQYSPGGRPLTSIRVEFVAVLSPVENFVQSSVCVKKVAGDRISSYREQVRNRSTPRVPL